MKKVLLALIMITTALIISCNNNPDGNEEPRDTIPQTKIRIDTVYIDTTKH